MAFREVTVVQVREALRRWLRGDGERSVARGVGIDRKTARRYIGAAAELGVDRSGSEEQLSDELIGQVVERVRPHRSDGHGPAWRTLVAEQEQIKKWVEEGLTVVKIGELLGRRGVVVPPRTLARFAVERCGAGRRRSTVRVDDPPPGTELQVDFGRLGLVPDGERRRVCHALVFTACYSRHQFVWPTFRQTTEELIRGFEAAWGYFGGVFPVVIPENVPRHIIRHHARHRPTEEREGLHVALHPGGRIHGDHRTHEHEPAEGEHHDEGPDAPYPVGGRIGPTTEEPVIDLSLLARRWGVAQHPHVLARHLLFEVGGDVATQRRRRDLRSWSSRRRWWMVETVTVPMRSLM